MSPSEPSVEVIVLGTGTSHGVPMIGCHCETCTSSDPRDQRSRPSIFVKYGDCRLLVDTAPELRLQCVANGITALDAVLFTHHHADHVLGLDDLRRFNWLMKRPVACYGSERTLACLRQMFAYAFEPATDSPHSRPQLDFHPIASAPFSVNGKTIIPIPLMHGPLPVLGFRFGRFGYCTDCNHIPESSMPLISGVSVLILDALRNDPHPAHFTLDEAVATACRIGAERTYFTHMTHQLKHEETNRRLPPGMALAHDGLRFRV
jgi:phosphoribosyl 1,2-cyclic phosphate phosphodiesterase